MLTTVLIYAGLVLAGVVAGLKVVAPLTKTKVDDKVLEYAELVEKILESLGHPAPAEAAAKIAADVSQKS